MSDEAFIGLCAQYPDYFLEMTSDGEVIVMPPKLFWAAMVSGEIVAQLGNWAVADNRGVTWLRAASSCPVEPVERRMYPGYPVSS